MTRQNRSWVRWRAAALGSTAGAVMAAWLLAAPIQSLGAATEQPRPAAFPGTSVAVVGDSLTVANEKYLKELAEAAFVRMGVDARIGRGTGEGVEVLSSPDRFAARVWVVALGTNDSPTYTESFAAKVDEVMELAGPGREVVWVDVYRKGVSPLNKVLQRKAEQYPNLTVVEYAEWVEENTQYLYDDQVHLKESGSQKLADMIWSEVSNVLTQSRQ